MLLWDGVVVVFAASSVSLAFVSVATPVSWPTGEGEEVFGHDGGLENGREQDRRAVGGGPAGDDF